MLQTLRVCCAHLLRELIGVIENHPIQLWAQEMIDLLLEMKEQRDKAVFIRKEELSYYNTHSFHKKYQIIIEKAIILNPISEKEPGKRGGKEKKKFVDLLKDSLTTRSQSAYLQKISQYLLITIKQKEMLG